MTRRRDVWAAAAAMIGLGVLAAGIGIAFAWRIESGGDQPAYSTLSTAPTGARAVFDSFQRLGQPEVSRNLTPLNRWKPRPGTTLVLGGAGPAALGSDTTANFEAFEALMQGGLHVVVALDPRSIPGDTATADPVDDPWRSRVEIWRSGDTSRPADQDGEEAEIRISAGKRWGFQFEAAHNPERLPADGYEVVPSSGGPPAVPRWFSVWRWSGLDDDWQPLATVDGKPVIIRRGFGAGSLTLLSDTVFLSNEALWRAPEPAFLLWLLAREPSLVFDETLHGNLSDPGVIHLLRRYRLLGFLAGAAVLLAFYIWRAGTSFVPVHPSVAGAVDHPLSGVEGASGFSNLLRQTVDPRHLLPTCVAEWSRSPMVRDRLPAGTLAAVEGAAAAGNRRPQTSVPAAYRSIVSLLKQKPRGPRPPAAG